MRRVNQNNPKPIFTRERFARMQDLASQQRVVHKGTEHIKKVELVKESETDERALREPKHTDEGCDYDLTYSLFDDKKFDSMDEMLQYIHSRYGFSVPRFMPFLKPLAVRKFWSVRDPKMYMDGEEIPVDTPTPMKDRSNQANAPGDETGSDSDEEDDEFARVPIVCGGRNVKANGTYALLFYLGSVIWRANDCIFCDKHLKGGASSVQKHMADCNHQRVHEGMQGELSSYYDWEAWIIRMKTKYQEVRAVNKAKARLAVTRAAAAAPSMPAIEGAVPCSTASVASTTDLSDSDDGQDPSLDKILRTVGFYEVGDTLVVGGTKVLGSRHQVRSESLPEDLVKDLAMITEARKTHDRKWSRLALGNGDGDKDKWAVEVADQRRQAMDARKAQIIRNDYRLQFKTHRLKEIVNLSTMYAMNNTGH